MPRDEDSGVFVAGATGAIGSRLCRLLVSDGWTVVGATRSPLKAAALEALGVAPVIVDVFDENALRRVVVESRAPVVIHQLTDLPPALDPTKMQEGRIRTARIRQVGTGNLVRAAEAAHVRRMIAQSIAFAYAPGPMPHAENAPLDVGAPDEGRALSARAVASLERQVLSARFEGIILRYGKLYGPGSGFERGARGGAVHTDAAAEAARLALRRGSHGIYNIAEEDGTVSSAKARRELGWDAGFRLVRGLA